MALVSQRIEVARVDVDRSCAAVLFSGYMHPIEINAVEAPDHKSETSPGRL